MTGDEFARLLGDFTQSAESGHDARYLARPKGSRAKRR